MSRKSQDWEQLSQPGLPVRVWAECAYERLLLLRMLLGGLEFPHPARSLHKFLCVSAVHNLNICTK